MELGPLCAGSIRCDAGNCGARKMEGGGAERLGRGIKFYDNCDKSGKVLCLKY